MKAILMTAKGGPEVLKHLDVPEPQMPDGQHVLVKVAAASVNPLDAKVRAANHVFPDHLPNILGCDGAGTVAAVGGAVTRFRRGDEVYFFNGGVGGDIPGTYAEYTLVPEAYLARKPKTATMVEAAALPLVLITAWESLVYRGGLEPGQKVLIHGATGGVGHIAIQLARHLRGQVAASVGDEDKGDYARELGAELVIHYGMRDFVESVLAWTDGEGVDLVLDPVGGEVFARSCAATRIYGRGRHDRRSASRRKARRHRAPAQSPGRIPADERSAHHRQSPGAARADAHPRTGRPPLRPGQAQGQGKPRSAVDAGWGCAPDHRARSHAWQDRSHCVRVSARPVARRAHRLCAALGLERPSCLPSSPIGEAGRPLQGRRFPRLDARTRVCRKVLPSEPKRSRAPGRHAGRPFPRTTGGRPLTIP